MNDGIADDLRQIGVVTKYEMLKHVRSRKMMIFVSIAVLLFVLITALNIIFEGGLPKDPTKFMEGYVSIIDLMLIIGVSLFCASTIAAEFEERTALLMFPRPMKRTSFFIGKVLACYIVCGAILIAYYILCMLLSILNTGSVDTNTFGSLGMALMFMLGAGGFALLMSSLFKKGSTAVIVTIASLLLILQIVSGILETFGHEPAFSVTYAAKDIANYISGEVTQSSSFPMPGGGEFNLSVFYPSHLMAFSIMATWAVITTVLSAYLFSKKEF
ncbi:MAG: ABC transporter permease [Methanomassiliicoccaceae archaeon]|nr:ABC transporter permease [Methanomassiliicoccaceae archaeon]